MFCSYLSTFHSSPWCLTSLSEASFLEGRWSWQEETANLFLPLASLPRLLKGYYQLLPDIVSLLFSCCSVVSDSFWPYWLQHARLPCPWPSPEVCSNSCPLSRWCHPTLSSSVSHFLLLSSIFPSIKVFSNESALHIRWPKYWSFSISPSHEYSGLVSFRVD